MLRTLRLVAHRGGRAWRQLACVLALIIIVCLGTALTAASARSALAGEVAASAELATTLTAPKFFKICKNQTYALCITASCFVFNGLAYCTCDIKHGDSISLPLNYGKKQDVCTVNAEGRGNGFMVSTYSVSKSLLAPRGDMALYTCPAATSDGAYAQCDGALCFTSTRGQSFPGSNRPLKPNQIICSCPIVVGNPGTAKVGYQIPGPYPCQQSYFANCGSAATNKQNGSRLYLGAPTGLARFLEVQLNGVVPPLNVCRSAATG